MDFNGEAGAGGLDGVQNVTAVFDGGVEEFAGEVFGVGAVPDFRVKGAGDIDAAEGADGVGESAALGYVIEVGAAFCESNAFCLGEPTRSV